MNIYSIKQIIALAKYTSPIYRDLYKDIDPETPFERLPIMTNEKLMSIVHDKKPDFVFSDGNTHGLIFESSASTGKPKVTLWGKDEWETSMRILANYHWRNSLLKEGDRLSNLCASPYLSYRIVHSVVENYPGKCSEIPIGCEMSFEELNSIIDKYDSNVLAGVNSTFLGLAYDLLSRNSVNTIVERILAGGELLYGEQLNLIKQAFPNATMVSFMFGTTESGIIGYSQLDDQLDVFRQFPGISIVEIIDEETNLPIREVGKVGKCVVTSLLRVAAPALRIDTGDYALWLDEPSEESPKFKVLGRKFPFYHSILGVDFSETDVWSVIKNLENKLQITKLQFEIHQAHIEVVFSVFNEEKSLSTYNEIIIDSVKFIIPALVTSGVKITTRCEDFDYFLESTRRKGRLVKDCRM